METGEHHEWALEFEELYPTMGPLLKADQRMLVLGCGNSTFSEKLYDTGYHKITNIDSIEEVIEYMRSQHLPTRPHMEWATMDATKLSFPDNHFDVVFDKTLLDCLMCATDYQAKVTAFFKEAKRVGKQGGLYISVTINPKVEDVAQHITEHLSQPKIIQITGKQGHLFHFLHVNINK
uniref:Methyltransferase type 11 domain-containing protein n=1 Tax=Arcella intermedia TaxID=1963864 RepID=A0A6B2LJW9_9EUKA